MTIKIFGALLILTSGSSIGWIIGTQYLNRVKELRELQLAINIFDTEISYGQTILPEALKFTASSLNSSLSHLFEEAAEDLSKSGGRTFSEIWHDKLKQNFHTNCLLKEDIQILEEWGQQIGNSSLTNQSKANRLTIKRLEHAEQRAQEIADKRVKLVRYSGVLVSLMVIILFY